MVTCFGVMVLVLLAVLAFLAAITLSEYDIYHEKGELIGDYLRRTMPLRWINHHEWFPKLKDQINSITQPPAKEKRKRDDVVEGAEHYDPYSGGSS